MSPPLFLAVLGHASVLAGTVTGVALCLGTLASVWREWIREGARSRRLERALVNTEPSQRAEIILACGALENKSSENKSSGGRRKSRKSPAEARVGLPRREKLALLPRGQNKD